MAKSPIYEVLTTAALTALGTASLVGVHHYYRRQTQPDARLQDYAAGLTGLGVQRFTDAYQTYCTQKTATAHITTIHPRPVCWVSGVAAMPKASKSANLQDDDSDFHESDFGVVGIDADRQIVWQTTMPERVHDIVVQPINKDSSNKSKINKRDVVVMGRRPSEWFWVLDTANGQVKYAIQAAVDRHFYGHACYSLDGTLLYVTENDTVNLVGTIGVYKVSKGYQKIAEFDAYGIGPHELIMHPDGEILIIANGGIKTEKASREELNLDSMQPSLVYLNRHNGALLEQVSPEHKQMSVRHLAVNHDGMVVIGIQFQGDKHINVPLVLTHHRGESELKPLLMPDNQWQRFHHYIASVAVDSKHNLLCATSPFGGCAAVFDLTTRALISINNIPDCAGVSALAHNNQNDIEHAGFIVSDGLGQLTTLNVVDDLINDMPSNMSHNDKKYPLSKRTINNSQSHAMSFDNHLQAL
ncbi:DUF1513 domain-containing protein [Psychrobacter sp. 16-MNA-CIBAN-0192]|uniref:DUF1513 domain-containing protein n=1 Tax=Psychrobacter sp. 16-MNA-CIBAN-0192 TaxID=3140448 RepID=UPI00331E7B67